MKLTRQVISSLAVAALAALIVGCEKPDTTSQQLDKVQAKTTEASQEMKDYTFAQKAEFTTAMQAQLAEINRELDQLEARLEKSNDAVKAEARPRLQALRDQSAQLNKNLDGVKNATESTWDSVKVGSKKAYDEMKEGFTVARQWLSDKLAP